MEAEPDVINLEDNYEVQRLKIKADPTLLSFIQRNCPDIANSQVIYQRLKLFYVSSSKKLHLNYNSHSANLLDHVKNVAISLLCQIDEDQTVRKIQKVKHEADIHNLNCFQLQKKRSQIIDKELYQHIAVHFLMYFVNRPLGQIIEMLRQIRKKITYQAESEGQVFQLLQEYPQIDFPVDIKGKFQCHCQMSSSPIPITKPSIDIMLRCSKCCLVYHSTCQSNLLYCSKCHLFENALLNRVQKILQVFYIFPHKFINAIRFELPDYHTEKLKHNEKWGIEIRVERVNSKKTKNASSAVFVDNYAIFLNNQAIKISRKSLLAGEAIKIVNKNLDKNNVLIIKRNNLKVVTNGQPLTSGKHPTFIVGIFRIQKNRTTSNKPQIVSIQQSRMLLEKVLEQEDRLTLDLNLRDPISDKKLQTPVRGLDCMHFRCFDWKSYQNLIKENPLRHLKKRISYNRINKTNKLEAQNLIRGTVIQSSQKGAKPFSKQHNDAQENKKIIENFKKTQRRQMRCPICQTTIQRLYIDPIVSKIISQTSSTVTQVQIDKNGNFKKCFSEDKEGFINIVEIDIED